MVVRRPRKLGTVHRFYSHLPRLSTAPYSRQSSKRKRMKRRGDTSTHGRGGLQRKEKPRAQLIWTWALGLGITLFLSFLDQIPPILFFTPHTFCLSSQRRGYQRWGPGARAVSAARLLGARDARLAVHAGSSASGQQGDHRWEGTEGRPADSTPGPRPCEPSLGRLWCLVRHGEFCTAHVLSQEEEDSGKLFISSSLINKH